MSEIVTLDDPLLEIYLLSDLLYTVQFVRQMAIEKIPVLATYSAKLQGIGSIWSALYNFITNSRLGIHVVHGMTLNTIIEEATKVACSIASEGGAKSDQDLIDKVLSAILRFILSREERALVVPSVVGKISNSTKHRAKVCRKLVTLAVDFADVGVDYQCWFFSNVWRIGLKTLGRDSKELRNFEAKFDLWVMPLGSELGEFLAWCKGAKYSVQEFHGCCDFQTRRLIPPLWSLVYTYLAMPSVREIKQEVLIKF